MLSRCLISPTLRRAPWRRVARGAATDSLPLPLFHSLLDCTLQGIQEVVEDYADESEHAQLEVELASDVLNISTGGGTFVLNKQTPNLQLWLSSPLSGPLRYDFCRSSATWINSRDGHALLPLLENDVEQLLQHRLSFEPVAEELRAMNDAAG